MIAGNLAIHHHSWYWLDNRQAGIGCWSENGRSAVWYLNSVRPYNASLYPACLPELMPSNTAVLSFLRKMLQKCGMFVWIWKAKPSFISENDQNRTDLLKVKTYLPQQLAVTTCGKSSLAAVAPVVISTLDSLAALSDAVPLPRWPDMMMLSSVFTAQHIHNQQSMFNRLIKADSMSQLSDMSCKLVIAPFVGYG